MPDFLKSELHLAGSRDTSPVLVMSCLIVCVSAVNVGSTLVAVFGVDRLGRRFLWIEAGIQMAVTHVLVAILMAVYLKADNVMAHGPAIGIIVIL